LHPCALPFLHAKWVASPWVGAFAPPLRLPRSLTSASKTFSAICPPLGRIRPILSLSPLFCPRFVLLLSTGFCFYSHLFFRLHRSCAVVRDDRSCFSRGVISPFFSLTPPPRLVGPAARPSLLFLLLVFSWSLADGLATFQPAWSASPLGFRSRLNHFLFLSSTPFGCQLVPDWRVPFFVCSFPFSTLFSSPSSVPDLPAF